MRIKRYATSLVTVVATFTGVLACSGAAPDGASGGDIATSKQSIVERIVAANADTEQSLHLVTRQVVNEGTEVAEFYEPQPGVIVFSAAGRPTKGATLTPKALQGKTVSEIWEAVAPGATMPQPLSDAIERQKAVQSGDGDAAALTFPAKATQTPENDLDHLQAGAATENVSAHLTDSHSIAEEAPSAAAAALQRTAAVADSIGGGGYCATQFPSAFAMFGTGNSWREAETPNWGYLTTSMRNVVHAGWAVCPEGNVSGTGGFLGWSRSNGYNVPTDTYRWVTTANASANCGWDISCWGTRCTPNYYDTAMTFYSNCYLTRGSSCGDNFQWIAFYNWTGSYCQAAASPGPAPDPVQSCTTPYYVDCGAGCGLLGYYCSRDQAASYNVMIANCPMYSNSTCTQL